MTNINEMFVLSEVIVMIVVKVKKQVLCRLFSQIWDIQG